MASGQQEIRMSFLNRVTSLVKDPPPNHLFELSEAGLAFARGTDTAFQPFDPGTLVVSPIEDNLLRPDAVRFPRFKNWRRPTEGKNAGKPR